MANAMRRILNDAEKAADLGKNARKLQDTLETLISRNGPVGSELTPPVKVSTDTHVYTFTGVWQDWAEFNINHFLYIRQGKP